MSDEVNNYFNFSNTLRNKSSIKGTSLASKLHKGLEILLKSLMKHL